MAWGFYLTHPISSSSIQAIARCSGVQSNLRLAPPQMLAIDAEPWSLILPGIRYPPASPKCIRTSTSACANTIRDLTTVMTQEQRPTFLFISPVFPTFDGIGVEQRAWSHLDALCSIGDVDLVLAMTAKQVSGGANVEELRTKCRSVRIVRLSPSSKLTSRKLPGLTFAIRLSLLWKDSHIVAKDELESFRQAGAPLCYDMAFCFRIRNYPVWQQIQRHTGVTAKRVYVDFDDIESITLARELPFLRQRLGRENSIVAKLERIETLRLEHRIQREADLVSVCSDHDRSELLRRPGAAEIAVVPNSFPFKPALPPSPESGVARIMFLGALSYPPNEDAILHFCDSIYPLIRRELGDRVSLTIVGRRPRPCVQELGGRNAIIVTGGVDSVEPYYAEADLVIAPIRFGGGTRIKILEALSYGRAVVSTTIGAEGLDLEPGRDLLQADSPEKFATACVELLRDPIRRDELATSGRSRVLDLYSRTAIQNKLTAIVSNLQQAPVETDTSNPLPFDLTHSTKSFSEK
ncbi:hypothetical protein CEW83_18830 [Parazoarcus communis]|uniref:Glycosyltransferase subfamily 4-like N-terminal domain-containing protein n=2 Tax=Parazoarcus communis TaxID=41977 RepID=A0A2U8GTN3_9RHOO|nr:hypothetical protein CEW83_18830 [Parazoarcus communis]